MDWGATMAEQDYMGAGMLAALTDKIDLAALPVEAAGAVRDMAAQIADLTKELSQNQRRLDQLMRVIDEDPVALVLNSRAFMREGQRAYLLGRRHQIPLTLLFLKIDNFLDIGSHFGARGGDAVLLEMGQRLQARVRGSDLVGRVSADEFGAVLMHSDRAATERKAEDLARDLRDSPVVYVNHQIPVSFTWNVQVLDASASFLTMVDQAAMAVLRTTDH